MASREELQLLREARAGNAQSQCELGKLYLFGSKSLPQSLPTALHWLSRAALQENTSAKLLIGNHIPYEMAKAYPDRHVIENWYREALEHGNDQAGLILAKLILSSGTTVDEKNVRKRSAFLKQLLTMIFPKHNGYWQNWSKTHRNPPLRKTMPSNGRHALPMPECWKRKSP